MSKDLGWLFAWCKENNIDTSGKTIEELFDIYNSYDGFKSGELEPAKKDNSSLLNNKINLYSYYIEAGFPIFDGITPELALKFLESKGVDKNFPISKLKNIKNSLKDNERNFAYGSGWKEAHKERGYIGKVKKSFEVEFEDVDATNINPDYKTTDMNCQTSVYAFVARKEGYNVRAKKWDENNNNMVLLSISPSIGYIDKETGLPPKEEPASLENMKEGRYYTVSTKAFGGHIAIYKKENGKLYKLDPQKNENTFQEIKRFKGVPNKMLDITNVRINETFAESVLEPNKEDN